MFFIVDKKRFQKMMRIAGSDPGRGATASESGPFLRIEAVGDRVSLSSRNVKAEFDATVLEPGVLFLQERIFAQLLRTISGERQISIQVNAEGLHLCNVRIPLEPYLMLLYADPHRAPARHPVEVHAERETLREAVALAEAAIHEAEQTLATAREEHRLAEERLRAFGEEHPEPPPDSLFEL